MNSEFPLSLRRAKNSLHSIVMCRAANRSRQNSRMGMV
jgi:hypothetical protein